MTCRPPSRQPRRGAASRRSNPVRPIKSAAETQRKHMQPHKTAIVVLGAPNDAAGLLSAMAVERCRQALCEFARHPDACILTTGGWGPHFNTTDKPHGYYTRRFLQQQGIPPDRFLECAESSNTIQDAELSRPIIARHGITALIVVTSDLHLPRAQFLFQRAFPGMELVFSAARTDLPAAELARLQAHETRALAALMQNAGAEQSGQSRQ